MTRVDWHKAFDAYPGRTIEDKLKAARGEKTFSELARELNLSESALKTFVYRHTEQPFFRGDNLKCHVVFSKGQTNYAARMKEAIRMFAKEQGCTEEAYREWIKTEEGEQQFLHSCARIKLPVFMCRYQPKKQDGRSK